MAWPTRIVRVPRARWSSVRATIAVYAGPAFGRVKLDNGARARASWVPRPRAATRSTMTATESRTTALRAAAARAAKAGAVCNACRMASAKACARLHARSPTAIWRSRRARSASRRTERAALQACAAPGPVSPGASRTAANETCVNSRCTVEPGCGNGQLDSGEQCENGMLGETCRSLGYDGGNLACRSCVYDMSRCYHDDPPVGGSGA